MAIMIELLHQACLVFTGQQRQDGGDLVIPHPVPVGVVWSIPGMHVAAGPLTGDGGIGMLGGAAASPCFFKQGFVMRLCRLEFIRTHDGFTGIVAITVSPGRRGRWIVADNARTWDCSPLFFDGHRAVAAEITRVLPESTVFIKIFGCKQVNFQRFNTRRHLAVTGCTDEFVLVPEEA